MSFIRLRRKVRSVDRRLREARLFARAMKSPRHPIVAHIIPIRRCNLSCAYCNEFDDHSPPVPATEMLRRVDLLAGLGTTLITISGGEPLLHAELETIIRHIRRHGIFASLISNGYLLTSDRIRELNAAGLDHLEISIDNVQPDEVSKKSLKVLDRKLQLLAKHAEFSVNINSVLGSSIQNPEDALVIAHRAREHGFAGTVGILHDDSGQLQPLNDRQRQIYDEIKGLNKPFYSFAQADQFQRNLVEGKSNLWQCHAGSRYLYVCEDGLVHWCSQQRGYPGIPLEQYTPEHLAREYDSPKSCAPYCTISCVHQTAILDRFREKPREALNEMLEWRREHDPSFKVPRSVKLLYWMFLDNNRSRSFQKLALRLLRVR